MNAVFTGLTVALFAILAWVVLVKVTVRLVLTEARLIREREAAEAKLAQGGGGT